MTSTRRGRPAQIQKEDILKVALDLLDNAGPQGLSMRTLAARLSVTPMALYHHIADRSALLRELSDWVYSGIVADKSLASDSSRAGIESLLLSYHKAVIHHPNLTLSIFADPDAFSVEAQRITQQLSDCLAKAKLLPSVRDIWLNILVDFTHGSSIATAMGCRSRDPKQSSLEQESENYARGLTELLDRIFEA